jgi:hypothetical protein
MNLTTIAQYAVTLAIVAAITILAALSKIDGSTAVAVIAGLGGVHLGAGVATPNTTTTNITNPPLVVAAPATVPTVPTVPPAA